jgi:hypothetical protein
MGLILKKLPFLDLLLEMTPHIMVLTGDIWTLATLMVILLNVDGLEINIRIMSSAHSVPLWVCSHENDFSRKPGSPIYNDILTAWKNVTYDRAVQHRQSLTPSQRGDPTWAQLANDSCGVYNIDIENHGTIWGLWSCLSKFIIYILFRLNSQGFKPNIEYYYPRGILTLVPNKYLNNETYTVGWMGEQGLLAEVNQNIPNDQSFFNPTSAALGIRLITYS